MAQMTAFEQLTLELINRARLDPAAESARLGVDLNNNLPPGTITTDSKAPLASNTFLQDAARLHSQWMNATDIFSHTGVGGSSPEARMIAAGYSFTGTWFSGENISWQGTSGAVDHLAFTIENYQDLFASAGHRQNMLSDNFREIGVGEDLGQFTNINGTFNDVMLTQTFARSGTNLFITGVAFNDTDGDRFYDIGEARGGVAVTLRQSGVVTGGATTEAAGGYAVATANGTYDVTFSGGGLPGAVTARIAMNAENAKVDLVGTNTIQSTVGTTLLTGAVNLTLLGIDNVNGFGNGLSNVITGNKGNNVLVGGNGHDRLVSNGGLDQLIGGLDNDTYVVVNRTSSIVEFAGEGTDTVETTTANFVLGNNLENLTFTGAGSFLGVGNALGNVITGKSGADFLSGLAGADRLVSGGGLDTLVGGTENDTYVLSQTGSTIVELAGGGTDTIETALQTLSIAGYNNVERLVYTGTAAFTGVGNALGNEIIGGGAADFLSGLQGADTLRGGGGGDFMFGGDGADNLFGGTGPDRFYYAATSQLGDTIHDFNRAEGDKININPLLTSVGASHTNPIGAGVVWFQASATPGATNIMFDSDGNAGPAGDVLLATVLNLAPGSFSASDFLF